MTTLYIIRHAEAEGNLYRRAHGWYDGDVTEKGRRQIAALERRFRDVPVDAAYASDLRRTQCTAQAVVRPKALELHLEPGLREIHMGICEDRTFGDIAYHKLFTSRSPLWAPEGGESFLQVQDRAVAAVRRIAAAHPGQSVAVFSHSIAIKCLLLGLRGERSFDLFELEPPENTAVSRVDFDGAAACIRYENDASHLPAELRAHRRGPLEPPTPQVWFKALDMDREAQLYADARQDAWMDIHGSLDLYDGPGCLWEARAQWEQDHRAVQLVMHEGEVIGILHLATQRQAQEGIGDIPFLYLRPEWRGRGVGAQLIGQAVSTYRAMGRRCLRLRCAPDNGPAQRLYRRCGFVKIGTAPGARMPLDVLEKPI